METPMVGPPPGSPAGLGIGLGRHRPERRAWRAQLVANKRIWLRKKIWPPDKVANKAAFTRRITCVADQESLGSRRGMS